MNKALLVIDFINDIVHPDGKISRCAPMVDKHHTMTHANTAIQYARTHHLPLLHVKVGFSANYIECPPHSPLFGAAKQYQALQLNTWGTEFHEAMDVRPEDTIIIKHRISAYYATSLATILDAQRCNHLLICGVSTNMAIESTARELHDRGIGVTVIADACAAESESVHDASLHSLSKIATLTTTTDLPTSKHGD